MTQSIHRRAVGLKQQRCCDRVVSLSAIQRNGKMLKSIIFLNQTNVRLQTADKLQTYNRSVDERMYFTSKLSPDHNQIIDEKKEVQLEYRFTTLTTSTWPYIEFIQLYASVIWKESSLSCVGNLTFSVAAHLHKGRMFLLCRV